ncbi:prephenate dehydrogenase [Thalassobacillus devorans]|uniref:prephenate dehydrogenase n=1 Tax=Thalassobacillus devorans TaxID=279813 RepID=UPI001593BA7E|nr:prephenate dehydrogenase [Thalassobacillus devorans]
MKETVMIAGLGLIGGSLAMSIRSRRHFHVLGMDAHDETCRLALEKGAVDEICDDFISGVQKADILIIATPIPMTLGYMAQLNEIQLEKNLLVTDVSSVKGKIMNQAEKITNSAVTFIGGHPMAGSHKQGLQAAKGHLFENAIYVLTPSSKADEQDVARIKEVLSPAKARFLVFTTEEHDEMTAVISHFPHLIASSLVHQARNWQKTHPFLEDLAAGGFRDITRIASSNPVLWRDIFLQNKAVLISMLDDWITEMEQVRTLLSTSDGTATENYLLEAKHYRDGLPAKKKGAIPSFYDIYVDIHDQPGALLHVIEHLADNDISIKNIEILEVREGITGVLRISFQSSEEQKESKRLLESHDYEVTIEQ